MKNKNPLACISLIVLILCAAGIFTNDLYAQKDTPCECAKRWDRGGHWNANGTINDAGNAPNPLGVIRCGSSAETMSNTSANGCVYNSSQFQINPVNGRNPDTGLPVTVNPPTAGCPVIWVNVDQRPAAGSYQYQIISSDAYSWALYYSTEHQQGIDANGLSGDCGSLAYYASGNSFSGWATFATPSFLQATNLYIAIWRTSGCGTQTGFSISFKARYGCGDADFVLCNVEAGNTAVSCNGNGTYTVNIPINGVNGNYQGYDLNATPTTSNTVTLKNIGSGGPVSGTITMTYPQTVSSYNVVIHDIILGSGDIIPSNPDSCSFNVTGSGLNCDDGNPQSVDVCQGGVCLHLCDDGNACTENSYVNGTCVYSNGDCNDNNDCTQDICNPATGCSHPGLNCDDGNPQSTDICVNSVSCTHTCDDGNACTSDTYSNGDCTFTTINCDDANQCTDDNCNSSTGCTNTQNFCDDGNPLSSDVCLNKTCIHTCNDDNACTFDSYSNGNCIFITNTCNDNDVCTMDVCSNGNCQHSTFCDDHNVCTTDGCRYPFGSCVYAPVVCNDNDFCTIDACNPANGNCVTTPKICNDGLDCTEDRCEFQCLYEPVTCDTINPNLDIACPPRMIIVIDESGSITGFGQGSTGVTTEVRNGLTGMFNAISQTDINVAVVEFNTKARRALIGGTFDFKPVKGNLNSFLNYVNDNNTSASNDHFDPEDYLSNTADAFTNWDAAFKLVQEINMNEGLAPLVIFFTDGMPTAYNNPNGTVTTGTGSTTVSLALSKAVAGATTTKAQGSHIFIVGFPNPTLPESNIHSVTGPNRYPDLEPDFTRADYSIETSASLEHSLIGIADLLCRADLRLSMKVSPSAACSGDLVTFTVKVTNDGLDKADTVEIKNYLPTGYNYISDDKGVAATFSGGVITWNVGKLLNAHSDSIKITASVNASGNFNNVAQVSYSSKGDNDSDPNNFSGSPDEDDEAAKAIGTLSCNDGNACTNDFCNNGSCAHSPVNCDDQNACTTDQCTNGNCSHTTISCNDNNACTTDGCNANSGCTHAAVDCNDNNACTNDACLTATGCSNTAINCNDNDGCTTDGCNAGICTHTQINCNDNNACTTDGCSSGCTHTAINCDDGNSCTTDACNGGACSHTSIVCNDNSLCTTDGCSNGQCAFTPVNCDDSNACTTDGCSNSAGCTHAQINCNDNVTCTTDACSTQTGCTHVALPNCCTTNSNCNDQNLCTTDLCSGGLCSNTAINCADNNACTTDGCAPTTGCTNIAINCNDNNGCTADACSNGICSNTPINCSDNNACTTDGCSSGNCTHAAVNCDDSNTCTTDACNTSTGCTHTQINCSDNVACTTDACSTQTGCTHTSLPNCCTSNSNCNDQNLCTTDLCSGGLCSNNAINCNDNNSCTTDACAPATGCSNIAINCNDNNACTTDACNNGICSNTLVANCCTSAANCNDNNTCTIDACSNSACTHANTCNCNLQITGLTLVYECTLGDIGPLFDGKVINRDTLCRFNVRANTCPTIVGSVKFVLNGTTFKIESTAPYALNGDQPSGCYQPWIPKAGSYTLTVTAYSGSGATGTAGTPLTVHFSVLAGQSNTACLAPPTADCAGKLNGTASPDDCGVCSGGTSGHVANSDKDNCGVCFGNNSTCCQTNAQCADTDLCTSDLCVNGNCTHPAISGCCDANSDCNDNNICTTDLCSANQCTHQTSGQSSPSYLRVINPAKSWRKLKLGYSSTGLYSPVLNVISGGNNKMCITLRTVGTPDWAKILVRPGGSSTGAVPLSNYISGSVANFTTFCIPLSAFTGFNFSSFSYIEIPYSNGAGAFEIHIARIEFTGGTTPFLWFGDSHTNNYHDGQSGGTSSLTATLVVGQPCGAAKLSGEEAPRNQIEKNITLNAFPNPFNEKVTIEFNVPRDERVRIQLFSPEGRLIATLFEGDAKSGELQQVEFHAGALANGVYFYRMTLTSGEMQNRKLILLK